MHGKLHWLTCGLLAALCLACDDSTSATGITDTSSGRDASPPDIGVDLGPDLFADGSVDTFVDSTAGELGPDGPPTQGDLAPGTCPTEMVKIPFGTFMMGCNAPLDTACQDDEKPYHQVMLSEYCIDTIPVTQQAYNQCILQGACAAPSDNFDPVNRGEEPVVNLSWSQAQGFCQWRGASLPTEAQWEKAARGDDGRIYPWGNSPPDCTLANYADCGGAPSKAGSLPAGASPYGVLDMAGSVWEWVHDWYDETYYAVSPLVDPTGPTSGTTRPVRGGSYGNLAAHMRTSNRSSAYNPAVGGSGVGFRCAR